MFASGSGNNIVNHDALLAALGNYGGPTMTVPILPGSPAMDAGSNSLIPAGLANDQRGQSRIANGMVDIGACEGLTMPPTPSTHTVTNTNDSGTGSLRAAILAAAGGDSIQFDPSLNGKMITLTSGELDITAAAKPLYIVGPGASLLTIKHSGGVSPVFKIASTATAFISGLTLTSGYDENVYNAGQLSIGNCTVSNGTGIYGYGIYFDGRYGGTLAINDCNVTTNNSSGIYFSASGGGTMTVTNSTMSANSPGLTVAGTMSASMSCTVIGCTISDNKNLGVYVQTAPTVTISGTTISGNANSGIQNSSGALSVIDSTIANNGAGATNAASQGGGVNNSGTLIVKDSTIARNSAYNYGGGIYQSTSGGSTTLANTIVAGNMNGNSPDVYGTVTANYSLIGNNTDPRTMFASGSGNNIVNHDALLAALGNYGGPTMTVPILPGSPAMDAGSNSLIPAGPANDQRGQCRIANGMVDIGAYEYQPIVTSISPTVGPTSGGTTVTILGMDLTGATAVEFGSTSAPGVVVNSATQITATAPANLAGIVHVTVVTLFGSSTPSSADQFAYYFNGPPLIVTQPASQVLRAGSTATLSVVAVGMPPLSYQWRFNGQPLPTTGGATVALDNLQSSDSGAYSVLVTSTSGSVTSQDARLIVYDAPTTPQPASPTLVAATQSPSTAQTALPRVPSSTQLKVQPSGTTIDPNKMTIVMTHGWTGSSADWPTSMAADLSSLYSSKANILAWDWQVNARAISPAYAASRTVSEGTALGNALMDTLGVNYNKPIHFLGHSLGTLVNCAAADYIHGDKRPTNDARSTSQKYVSTNTHMTLFDEAELVTAVKGLHVSLDVLSAEIMPFQAYNDAIRQLKNFWSKVVPDHSVWIDNYISEIGLLQYEATNVMLWRKNYANFLFAPHGYACEWYQSTITNPLGSTMGHRWSFERDSLPQAPVAPAYYLQSLDLNASEMTVNPINLVTAQSLSLGRLIVYPTLKAAQGLNALGTTIQGVYLDGIQSAGSMVANFAETFSTPKNTPVYLGTAGSTAAYFLPAGQTASTSLQASWDLQFSIQPGGAQSQQKSDGPMRIPMSPSSTGPVYTIIPVHVPNEAVGLTFEYSITGAVGGDFMTMGIGSSNEYTMEANFLDDGVWNGTPVIPISDQHNQDVQLVFALNGESGAPTGMLSVRNIQFYIPPSPQVSLDKVGNALTASWPLSAMDWTLETTTDLSDPNGWEPVTYPPTDTDFFHTMLFDVTGTNKAFFRLKK